MSQTYQQVTEIILRELITNSVDFKKVNIQTYFYDLKNKTPEKYERLFFNVDNYSRDLNDILFDLNFSGRIN
jgi:hypothetical protein